MYKLDQRVWYMSDKFWFMTLEKPRVAMAITIH